MKRPAKSTPSAPSATTAQLRSRAVTRLRGQRNGHRLQDRDPRPAEDFPRLLHELQVHQIELEMQNEELRISRDEMEAGLEKYSELYDFAPVGYLTLDREGAIREANLTAAGLLGIPRAPLMKQRFGLFVAPADRPGFNTFFRQIFDSDDRQECEVQLLVEGKPPVDVRIRANHFESDEACRLAMTDITDHKRAEDKVRVSEIRYRRLFEAAHDGVLLLDPATRKITDANPFMTKLLGYSRDQLVGKELFEIGLLKDEVASQEAFQELKRKHEVRYENLPLESQGGRHQEVEVVANLYEENGHAVIQCNIRDITARKQAEEVRGRLAAIVDSSSDAIISKTLEGIIASWNEGARRLFAYRAGEIIGQPTTTLIPPDRWHEEHKVIERIRRGESITNFETIRLAKGGRRREVSLSISPIRDAAGTIIGASEIARDITAHRRAEVTRRRAEVLAAAHKVAKRDIARRRVVEKSLRESELIQRRLLGESRELHAQLNQLTRQIITVQEEERKAISRALHDEIMQTLIGINLQLSLLGKAAFAGGPALKAKIARTQQLVNHSVIAVHRFARDLRPAVLDDLGLLPALHAHIKNLTAGKTIKIQLTASGRVEALGSAKRTVLFRVAQEALTNVIRHSEATRARVNLRKIADKIRMEISDNGKSFDVGQILSAKNPKRLGLLGMKERIEMIGGKFAIVSRRGPGMTVRVEIPFDEMISHP